MTARAKVNGKDMVYVGWIEEEKPTQEKIDLEFSGLDDTE